MMEMNNSEVRNRVASCEAGSQVCGADFISLLHTHIKRKLQVLWHLDAHPLDQLLQYGEHAVFDVKVDGARYEMPEHAPRARLGAQSVGLLASAQHLAHGVVVGYHALKQTIARILSEY
jgi:hypothetical protein